MAYQKHQTYNPEINKTPRNNGAPCQPSPSDLPNLDLCNRMQRPVRPLFSKTQPRSLMSHDIACARTADGSPTSCRLSPGPGPI